MGIWIRNLSTIAALVFSTGRISAESNYIDWRTDYHAALREAKQTHKPLLVEFRCEA